MSRAKARKRSRPPALASERRGPVPAESEPALADPGPLARSTAGVRRDAFLGLALLSLTLLAYLPALDNGFIWDDDDYVTANPTLRSLDGLRRIWLEPGAVPQYYPLTFTSLWIDYHLGGLEPFGYHLVNVLLHALNAILAWRILLRLEVPGAWLAAALFAVHPVHVESVAWITERKNVLSGVFYLGALLAYLRFAGIGPPGPARDVPRWYALALGLFLAGLLSKTVVATLPAALVLLLGWKRGRIDIAGAKPLLPFFGLGAALALVTVWMERAHVGAVGRDWDFSFVDRCLIAGRAVWFYLGKLLWPSPLVFIYPRWRIDAAASWQYLFPAAALAAVLVLWALRRRVGLGPLIAFLFFVGTLGPALGFVDVFPMRYSFVADHFQYLASLGPLALVAGLGSAAAARLTQGGRRVAAGGAAVAVLLLVLLTARQSESYADARTLWAVTIERNPGAWMAHNNLGLLLADEGRFDEAMQHYRSAIAVKPDDAFARNNLGRALAATGRVDEAVVQFQEAVALEPGAVETWSNLGNALAAQGRFDEAIVSYGRALELRPAFADAHSNLGNVLFLTGRGDEALRAFGNAVQLDPDFADARHNYGVALATAGRLAEAEEQLAAAIRLRPSYAEAYHQLGLVLARGGRFAEAAAAQREALRLRPAWPEAERELAAAESGALR